MTTDRVRFARVRRALGTDTICSHRLLDPHCEVLWNLVVIGATALLAVVFVTAPGTPLRQLVGFGYLMFVPGMAIAAWLRNPRASLISAESLMLVVPLGFFVAVAGSLPMIYSGHWHPGVLLGFTALGSFASARARIRRHVRIATQEVNS